MANCSVTHIGRKMKQFDLFYSDQPNSTNGRTHNSAGYILIKPKGEKRLGSTKYGYIYEHRYIMEQHLGRQLKSNEIIHHINGKPDDNRIENLCLIKSQKEHLKFHRVGLREKSLSQKSKVLKLRNSGKLALEIAKEVDLSQPTVLKILDEYPIVCNRCNDRKFDSHKALGMHIVRIHRNSKHHKSMTRAKEELYFVN